MSLLGPCSNIRPTHLGSRGGRCIVADSGCIRHCCTRTLTTNACQAGSSLRPIHRRSRYHHRISNPAGRIDRFCKRTPSRPNRSHSGSLVRRSRRHSRELGRTAIRREYMRRYGSCTRSDLDDKSRTHRLPCLRPRGRRSRAYRRTATSSRCTGRSGTGTPSPSTCGRLRSLFRRSRRRSRFFRRRDTTPECSSRCLRT